MCHMVGSNICKIGCNLNVSYICIKCCNDDNRVHVYMYGNTDLKFYLKKGLTDGIN